MTLTHKEGDALAVLLEETRQHIAAGSAHLASHEYVEAVNSAHGAEMCLHDMQPLLAQGEVTHHHSAALLGTQWQLLTRRIRLAIGI